MRIIVFLRFTTYVVCATALWLSQQGIRVIPVSLSPPEVSDRISDALSAVRLQTALVAKKNFRNARLSGSEVVALARRAANATEDYLKNYGEPQISLDQEGGKLIWHVSYYYIPSLAGGFFTVSIDDQTQETKVGGGM
jgi:hypothetical protein